MLYPCKRYCRCTQAQHFLVCCWLVPRSGQGDAEGSRDVSVSQTALLDRHVDGALGAVGHPGKLQTMVASTLRTLPPPVDSVFYLIGDSMLKEQGRRSIPWGIRHATVSMTRTPLALR
jgi:hypothetical protein